MERQCHHCRYRGPPDCAGCSDLRCEQDRHRRCEHQHVSAPHDRSRKHKTHRRSQHRDCAVDEVEFSKRAGAAVLAKSSQSLQSQRCSSRTSINTRTSAENSALATEPRICALPARTRMVAWLPAESDDVVKVACPLPLSVPVPSTVAPSLKVTVPVGVAPNHRCCERHGFTEAARVLRGR